jgi:aryl-alcohol dehydrogenase-like predicted oxidoreductase
MRTRNLGAAGPPVGAIGYGTMGFTGQYGNTLTKEEAKALINRALDLGSTLIDTAPAYGKYTNEPLVGAAIAERREEVVLSTKAGYVLLGDEHDPVVRKVDFDGSPEYVAKECDESLQRLGVEHIELYYMHRLDPKTPVEETIGGLAELIAAGKIGRIGLCEVDIETMERARSVHPIAALQSEFSLFTREPLADVIPWCAENDVSFVPYSPLGRGFLSGRYRKIEDFGANDYRVTNQPRLAAGALEANLKIVDKVEEIAARIECSAAQVALAWILAQGDHIVPIQGADKLSYLEENLAAGDLSLDQEVLTELDSLPAPVGARY